MSSEILRLSKEKLKGNFARCLGVTFLSQFIIFSVTFLTVFMFALLFGENAADLVSNLTVLIIAPLGFGIIQYYLNVYEGNGELKDIFKYFGSGKLYFRSVCYTLLIGAIFGIGIFVLAIPVGILIAILSAISPIAIAIGGIVVFITVLVVLVYFSISFAMMPYYMIDNDNLGIFDALGKSFSITRGKKLAFIWCNIQPMLVPFILFIVSMVVLGLGGTMAGMDYANGTPSGASMTTAIIGGLMVFVSWIWLLIVMPKVYMAITAYFKYVTKDEVTISSMVSADAPIEQTPLEPIKTVETVETQNIEVPSQPETSDNNDGPVIK